MACVFLEIGQDVHIAGGDLAEAVNEGVRRGYDKGYLRKSVVKDPVRRGNTGDNTPAMLYTEIVPGDQIKVTVGPKGFGRYLKWEQKEASRQKKEAAKQIKIQKKRKPRDERRKKNGQFPKSGRQKKSRKRM